MKKLYGLLICLLLASLNGGEGIRYEHLTTDVPQSIHVVEIDPQQTTLLAARALDKCVGRETVSSLSKRKGAAAALNGGFFSIGGNHDGAPCGILKAGGVWYGLPIKPRGAIGWTNASDVVLFDRLLTHQEGIEFCIDPQIDPDSSAQWNAMDYVVGGSPLLIYHGEKITDYSAELTLETFLTQRHARTAVGKLPNGHWVFVVVDGKQPGYSIGMTMKELADFMEGLGCVEALNLDGGGSSTLVLSNQIVNQPAGDGDASDLDQRVERAVSDAILVFQIK